MTSPARNYEKSTEPVCPACDEHMERLRRRAVMRILIGSKYYYCWHCHRGYLRFLGTLIPF